MDAGGVGNGVPALDGPGGEVDFLLLTFGQAEDDDVGDSFKPHEARTRFSTFTVSSRNISESWSLYPGQALESRRHCVHSGCRLSHCSRLVSPGTLNPSSEQAGVNQNKFVLKRNALLETCLMNRPLTAKSLSSPSDILH